MSSDYPIGSPSDRLVLRRRPGVASAVLLSIISFCLLSPTNILLALGASNLALLGIVTALCFAMFLLAAANGRLVSRPRYKDLLPTALMVYVVMSLAWATAFPVAVQQVLAVLVAYFTASQLTKSHRLYDRLRILLVGLLAALIFSVVIVVMYPELGYIHNGPGQGKVWRGVFAHKNLLGRFSALSIVIALTLFAMNKKLIYLGAAIFSFLVLIKSSSGGMLLFSVGFMGLSLVVALRGQVASHRALAYATVLVGLSLVFLPIILPSFPELTEWAILVLGRSQDFTTLDVRLSLWSGLLDLANNSYVFGLGFDGVWANNDLEFSVEEGASKVWSPEQAHNGWIDLFLSLGLIGCSLVLCLILSPSLLVARKAPGFLMVFVVGVTLWYLSMNSIYSVGLGQSTYPSLMLFLLYRAALESRAGRA